MAKDRLVLGWGAPSFADQFPDLPPDDAAHFDQDSKAISRLAVRGMITRAQRDQAASKLGKMVSEALAASPLSAPGGQDGR